MIPSPASTVVLVREAEDDVEILLLLRNTKLKFEGGAWVFPGGKVDPGDYPSQSADYPQHGGDRRKQDYLAAINAVIRETREEAGLSIAPSELIHIAHWTTPMGLPRRYATWFFLCPLHTPVEIVVDDDEILDYQWLTPRIALALHEAGTIRLPNPTSHTLRSIAHYNSVTRLCTDMRHADIHVFPENSDYYQPFEGIIKLP
ncbi:NUDIX hydrolase [Pseudohongiella sp.]|uniref:Nudix hydrolase domain-containing protein n=1 Tax=marine sediment metagenome TaxID=412755 RepID=A0A0F9W6D4_9ZZZZ|nr:NUDIX hydrolase [Pseudohongiella sp.]HDZ08100.1 NUDIX hydrolase [Pseudohongiella sp.]HEA63068.1 NUDIX hydrolase [Pseudohongiella sp.]